MQIEINTTTATFCLYFSQLFESFLLTATDRAMGRRVSMSTISSTTPRRMGPSSITTKSTVGTTKGKMFLKLVRKLMRKDVAAVLFILTALFMVQLTWSFVPGAMLSYRLADVMHVGRSSEYALRKGLNCASPIRLGDAYGGWCTCRPTKATFANKLVYTIGIGRNIKWDEEMIKTYNTSHHGFDPTPTAKDFFKKHPIPPNFHFHQYGLGEKDGNVTLKLPDGNFDSYTILEYNKQAQSGTVVSLPMLSVHSMMKMLKHKWLSILKMDIEGAEFGVIDQWFKDRFYIPADQILIEFHERYFIHDRNYKNKIKSAIAKLAALDFDLIMYTSLEYTFARRDAIATRQKSVIRK